MKKIGLVLLVLLGGTLSGLYYFWHQATKLPDWYQEGTPQGSEGSPEDIEQRAATVQQTIQAKLRHRPTPSSLATASSGKPSAQVPQSQPNGAIAKKAVGTVPAPRSRQDVEVQLNPQELNDVLVSKIAEQSQAKALPKSVKSVRTTVEADTLKTGAIVDMKALRESDLGTQEQTFLTEAAAKFPGLSDRKVYIGIEGKPRIQDGKVQFDDETRVRVGNLRLTIAEIAERFGVSPDQVKEQLALRLQFNNLHVKDIELLNGTAILRGSPTPTTAP
ncbi:hypothetical protein [Myxacorys almedinensis]|uniref:Uncharacterized protein n=1 Tax=Myxacorys almedinensis A TaxID=2690445 RepID=A0A8J7Z3B0_9CYAN|nr:hypothetical protein [Myxacorys almedinensis]NDJ19617.1 hypothetical protein [Myxacorys almedinensis A]